MSLTLICAGWVLVAMCLVASIQGATLQAEGLTPRVFRLGYLFWALFVAFVALMAWRR